MASLFRIAGTINDSEHNIYLKNNILQDSNLLPNKFYNSENFEAIIEQYFPQILFTSSDATYRTLDVVTFKAANGSYIYDSNNKIYKIDDF